MQSPPPPEASRGATIIAIVNHKGGSAKTTSVVNLAGVFAAEMGKRVLAIDVDSQANCTMALGYDPYDLKHNHVPTLDALIRFDPDPRQDLSLSLSKAILRTQTPNLFLVPSSLDLARVENGISNAIGRERRLARLIEPVRPDFDLILLDCPPSLTLYTTNALFAADYVLIPVDASFLSVAGVTAVMELVYLVRQQGANVTVAGAFNTRVGPTSAAREAVARTRKEFASLYIDCPVKSATASEKAIIQGRPLVIMDKNHHLSVTYRELAHKVLGRIGMGPEPSRIVVPDEGEAEGEPLAERTEE